jgi:hypothetical protein
MEILIYENDKLMGQIVSASEISNGKGLAVFIGLWDGLFPWYPIDKQTNPIQAIVENGKYQRCFFTECIGTNLNPQVKIECLDYEIL